jgi:amino acid transporter
MSQLKLILIIQQLKALIASGLILGGDIESLIDFFSFTVWIFYGMSMLALLLLRKNNPNLARPYKVSRS